MMQNVETLQKKFFGKYYGAVIWRGVLFLLFMCTTAQANAILASENTSEIKELITEVRKMRDDLKVYNKTNSNIQSSLAMLLMQLGKANRASDNLAAITNKIDDLESQNSSDRGEIRNLDEQASNMTLNSPERNALGTQVSSIRETINDREKLIGGLREKEVATEVELKESQKALDVIVSNINQLKNEFDRR